MKQHESKEISIVKTQSAELDCLTAKTALIIVNYNSGKLLHRCLRCLSQQTVHPARIIVVDNASSDGSSDSIKTAGNDVELLRIARNVGFSRANNLAVSYLHGVEWVAFLNPDAFPEANWLEELLKATIAYPTIDIFASRLMKAEPGDILDGAGDTYHFTGLAWRRFHGASLTSDALAEKEVFSACAGAAMYRMEAFKMAGGFDEHFFCYMEDVDLGYRLRLMGKRCMYIPTASVVHMGSAISGKISGFVLYYGHRNIVWTFLKDTPLPLLILLLPWHVAMTFVLLGYFSCKGLGFHYLRSKRDAIKGLSAVLRDRKRIQQKRCVSVIRLAGMIDFRPYRR